MSMTTVVDTGSWIDATQWDVSNNEFHFEADINKVIDLPGNLHHLHVGKNAVIKQDGPNTRIFDLL